MTKDKKMTIEDLAIITQAGFAGVDERFKSLEIIIEDLRDWIKSLDNRLTSVENRLSNVEKRLGTVEDRLTLVESRLDIIEKELFDIKNKIDNIVYRHEFELLRDKVSHLEKLIIQNRKK